MNPIASVYTLEIFFEYRIRWQTRLDQEPASWKNERKECLSMLANGLIEDVFSLSSDDPILFFSLFQLDSHQNLRVHTDCALSSAGRHEWVYHLLTSGRTTESCRILWEAGCFDSLFFQHYDACDVLREEEERSLLLRSAAMTEIPSGRFWMGALERDERALHREGPRHEVEITHSLLCGRYMVNQMFWEDVMGYSLHLFSGRAKPASKVNWFDAILFCNRLSEREGLSVCYHGLPKEFGYQWQRNIQIDLNPKASGYRLPTEAEWEYISKRGNQNLFSGSDVLEEVGWGLQGSKGTLMNIAQKRANPSGIYDMNGLLSEWCNDSWTAKSAKGYFVRDERATDPLVWSSSQRDRVHRGGNFLAEKSGKICRNSARTGAREEKRSLLHGFRMVRTVSS
ncbi:MAG: SUMF1/EgtB/PvdO family nonheme iron enzyme [Myxococcota bacterium]|nr:SUMF1/EgtB/PvdO family nonheme iron enzyme [Myxococcota bacterium]